MKNIYLVKKGNLLPKELLQLPSQSQLSKNQRVSIAAGMDILIFKENKEWIVAPAKINQEGSLIAAVRARKEHLCLLQKFIMRVHPSIKNKG
ncbi:hypothetical protein [Aeromonas phage AerS_266]|nr:hypothetical protein [Aeromonas phage AerS_266]